MNDMFQQSGLEEQGRSVRVCRSNTASQDKMEWQSRRKSYPVHTNLPTEPDCARYELPHLCALMNFCDTSELVPVLSEDTSESDSDVEISALETRWIQSHLHTSTSGPGCSRKHSSCLLCSPGNLSPSRITSAETETFKDLENHEALRKNYMDQDQTEPKVEPDGGKSFLSASCQTETLKRSKSLPDMKLNSSFEEFTPDISVGEDDETYSFRFSRSGLYQCSVTGLLFHMEGEGDVVYRTVPWNRRLLAQHHKKPAGPLFDIKCEQQSVCQLHLPHCEILSTGRCHFLSVAHVNDDVMEFISPHKITETHVVVNLTGFSEFGNVMDEGAPPDPVRALVLLFYKPPTKTDPESVINVLMLPKNIFLPDVLRYRKKLDGDERYIETSSKCKLHPDQDYTLSTCPEDDSVLVQPTEAEFDCSNYDNYFPSFQVELERIMKHIKLLLRDKHSSNTVWERRVCLSYAGVKRSCEPSPLDLPSDRRLLDVRSSFIESVSDPVLKTLLDRLFDKKVITDSERESADEIKNNRDKARCVMDTVRRKGEAASSEMIKFLCELDPFLCEHLGLM